MNSIIMFDERELPYISAALAFCIETYSETEQTEEIKKLINDTALILLKIRSAIDKIE